ncbi:hypothetical protein ADL21_15805, partial [Streptomyces albus subsp. albus]
MVLRRVRTRGTIARIHGPGVVAGGAVEAWVVRRAFGAGLLGVVVDCLGAVGAAGVGGRRGWCVAAGGVEARVVGRALGVAL